MNQASNRRSTAQPCYKASALALGLTAVLCLFPQSPVMAQVGQTLQQFEKISGKPIDNYQATDGTKGLVYRDVWFSQASQKQFTGRTAIEMGSGQRVIKEVFFFDDPLPNNADGAKDAVGIAFNLLPDNTPKKFANSGKRPYQDGYVLWFDYGSGRYLNFFLNKAETKIEAVVAGIEATQL